MNKQLRFDFMTPQTLCHGGELAKGKRKTQRPLKTNRPIHIVLRANRSMLRTKERKILALIAAFAKHFKLRVYRVSVNSNHIHLVLATPRRENFQNYLRTITGLIARLFEGKLWEHLAFSRVASWGKEYKTLIAYVVLNQREAQGLVSYRPRAYT